MSFTNEVIEYVIKYLREKYGDFNKDDIKHKPWHEVVEIYWDALVFYGKTNWYADLNDVKQPTEDMHVWIKTGELVTGYRYHRNGYWIKTGDMDSSIYKE